MNTNNDKEGILYAALSYIIWGFFPIYWKLIDYVSAGETLAQRVFWAFAFMVLLLIFTKKWPMFVNFVKEIVKKPKLFWSLFIASLLISVNWGVFIWAVNAGRILETSLGYYINPLISVLLGVIVLKEKLSGAQIFAFVLAGIGVLTLTIHFGSVPWVSLSLAITFGLYGLAKKMIKADSEIGLTLETMMMVPFALGYLIYIMSQSQIQFFVSLPTALLLIGGGVATALPLLFFAKGVQKVSLSMLGILQYIAPTLSLMVGVFIYHEAFTKAHLIAFIFIWLALIIYTLSVTKWGQVRAERMKHKREMRA